MENLMQKIKGNARMLLKAGIIAYCLGNVAASGAVILEMNSRGGYFSNEKMIEQSEMGMGRYENYPLFWKILFPGDYLTYKIHNLIGKAKQ